MISIKGANRGPATQETGLFSNVKDNGSGAGGDIEILANQLWMSNGAEISAETRGQGRAGSINMVITDSFESDNSRVETAVALPQGSSSLPANEATAGGDIHLQSNRISLNNHSVILSQSQRGPGNAGNITILGKKVFSDQNSTMSTEAESAAGGNIEIRADTLQLTRASPISASVKRGQGGGGNVTINAESFAALENSDITARADTGFGGDITINAKAFLRSPDVNLNASSNIIGNEGNVQINTPDLDIAGSISNLPTSFLNAASLLSSHCAARTTKNMSSFVVTGAGGVPPGPEHSSLSGYTNRSTEDFKENTRYHQSDFSVAQRPGVVTLECSR
jgi:large exoprotein involved in heme utilization and adhesion